MVVVHMRRSGEYLLRSLCKQCNNTRERGHRREWKTKYLRKWRENNPELNESYWRKASADKQKVNVLAYAHFLKNHYEILIQGRLRRRLNIHVGLNEARGLLQKYGPCYPTNFGLTQKGLRECERIRSRLRRIGDKPSLIDIRMMVYEDGLHIKPRNQKIPFTIAAEKLRRWHRETSARANLFSQRG